MFSKRLKKFIDYQRLSIRAFEKDCTIKQGTLSRIIKNDTSITSDNLALIAISWKEIDTNWLLTGEGEMLRSASIISNSVEEGKDQCSKDKSARADKEIEWQRKQIDLLTKIIENHSKAEKEDKNNTTKTGLYKVQIDFIEEFEGLDKVVPIADFAKQLNIVNFVKSNHQTFGANPNEHYSDQEALRLIASAISQGSELQKNISLIRDTYHAVWRLADFGFRKTSIEIAEMLVPQAAWHQKYLIAQDMCEELEKYHSLFGDLESMNKYAALYKRYKEIRDYEYEAKKMYNEVVYRYKRGLPIDTDKVLAILQELKHKLPNDNLCYHYIFFECKSLVCKGTDLENLYIEAIDYFESLYFNHSTYTSIFTKHLIGFYTTDNQPAKAKALIKSKIDKYEPGSTPWFRFMMIYANFLANQNDNLVLEITNTATNHPKFSELPEDNRIEWSVIIEKAESIYQSKIVNDEDERV